MAAKHNLDKSPSAPKIGIPATAVVTGSFLSGAMMSLSAFAVPVFIETARDPGQLVAEWARLYHYGHIYLPALCVATCGLYGFAALKKRQENHRQAGTRYALAAISTIAMVPFTWIVMTPTNNVLFGLAASENVADEAYARVLVVKWAWMHITRSLTPLVGAFLGFTTLLREIRA